MQFSSLFYFSRHFLPLWAWFLQLQQLLLPFSSLSMKPRSISLSFSFSLSNCSLVFFLHLSFSLKFRFVHCLRASESQSWSVLGTWSQVLLIESFKVLLVKRWALDVGEFVEEPLYTCVVMWNKQTHPLLFSTEDVVFGGDSPPKASDFIFLCLLLCLQTNRPDLVVGEVDFQGTLCKIHDPRLEIRRLPVLWTKKSKQIELFTAFEIELPSVFKNSFLFRKVKVDSGADVLSPVIIWFCSQSTWTRGLNISKVFFLYTSGVSKVRAKISGTN